MKTNILNHNKHKIIKNNRWKNKKIFYFCYHQKKKKKQNPSFTISSLKVLI